MGALRLCRCPTDVRRAAASGRCSPGNDAFGGASLQSTYITVMSQEITKYFY